MARLKRPGIPVGVKRLFRSLSYDEKVRKFQIVFGREAENDEEMDRFFLDLASRLWEEECDQWPADDIELDDLDGYEGTARYE
jgi:hypothetical protein